MPKNSVWGKVPQFQRRLCRKKEHINVLRIINYWSRLLLKNTPKSIGFKNIKYVINVINMFNCRQTISRAVLDAVTSWRWDKHLPLSYNRLQLCNCLTDTGSVRCRCHVFGASHQLWGLPLATNGNWVFLPKYSFSSLFRPDRMELIANQDILRVVRTRGFAW